MILGSNSVPLWVHVVDAQQLGFQVRRQHLAFRPQFFVMFALT
jgi:hypothetical protein